MRITLPRVVRRAYGVLTWGLAIAAAAVAVMFVVLTVVFHWQFSTVLSGSMEPKYPVGSMAVVVPVRPEQIEVGDVITFKSGDRRVSHRVVEIKGVPSDLSFATKGDANKAVDRDPVPQRDVIGRVRGDVPGLGQVLLALKTPAGKGVLVSIVVGSVAFALMNRKKPARARESVRA